MTPELIERIHAANVWRSVKYTARSLLDWADDTGFMRVDYKTALQVAEIDSVSTLRSHLHILKKSDIVDSYHLNGAVSVAFLLGAMRGERAQMRGERAQMRGERAFDDGNDENVISQNDHDCAVSAQNCAVSAQNCAVSAQPDYIYTHAHAPALVGWLVNNNSPDPLEDLEPTNQPEPTMNAVEQAQTYALLISIRMRADNARRISESLPFLLVRQYVARWWFGRKKLGGKFDDHPGILVRWLESPGNYPTEREFSLEMLRDIGPAAITNAEAAQVDAVEVAAEQTFAMDEATTSPPLLSDAELAEIWQAAQPSLQKLANYKSHLSKCKLVSASQDGYVVAAPPGIADMVQSRFVTALRRALSSATGASVLPIVRVEVSQ